MDIQQSQQACPNQNCKDYHSANFVRSHAKQSMRFRCKSCGKTWSAHSEKIYFGLRTNPIKVQRAADMLKANIPIRKIAKLVDVSAGTIMRWKKKFKSEYLNN